MTATDRGYFSQRAETELASARRASHPDAIKAHYMLAGFYLNRAFGNMPAEHDTMSQPEEKTHGE